MNKAYNFCQKASSPAGKSITKAYLMLLGMPDGKERIKLQGVLCELRDALAAITGYSSEEVQNICELIRVTMKLPA